MLLFGIFQAFLKGEGEVASEKAAQPSPTCWVQQDVAQTFCSWAWPFPGLVAPPHASVAMQIGCKEEGTRCRPGFLSLEVERTDRLQMEEEGRAAESS